MQHHGVVDLTFDLAAVNLTFKILSGPYLRNTKVQELDSWMGYLLWVYVC